MFKPGDIVKNLYYEGDCPLFGPFDPVREALGLPRRGEIKQDGIGLVLAVVEIRNSDRVLVYGEIVLIAGASGIGWIWGNRFNVLKSLQLI
jgi:hypothetical protein